MKLPDKFYQKIVQLIPIACVDLLVTDRLGLVLLLKRKEPPAQDLWWFPGGRVLHHELRIDAARRKLKEECGVDGRILRELGTYDLIFDCVASNCASHNITTVFHMSVNQNDVKLDNQSTDYSWQSVDSWLKEVRHKFLIKVLNVLKG